MDDLCKCCNAALAKEHDPHVGGVCIPCHHALDHIGDSLTDNPILQMCHPPALGIGLIFFPNN